MVLCPCLEELVLIRRREEILPLHIRTTLTRWGRGIIIPKNKEGLSKDIQMLDKVIGLQTIGTIILPSLKIMAMEWVQQEREELMIKEDIPGMDRVSLAV